VINHLAQSRSATEGGSIQDVKQALYAVVQGINTLIDERKNRQQQRLKNWGKNYMLFKKNSEVHENN
jgi:hypothetical protein